jgi:SPP1 gp7 family putative phage head morphogenesis protein
MDNLYRDDLLTLAAGDNEANFQFDRQVFERAAGWIREKGGFTPGMLGEQPARDVIAGVYRVLGAAVSSAITTAVPAELVTALEENTFIFSGFKTFHALSEVGLSLVGEDGGIKPFEKFHADVVKINEKYNENYLYAEYNHAAASAQMAVKWHDFEEDGERYNLQYRTANDEKVREDHQRLHNTTLPPSDPFWGKYLPPNGWNCRCTAVQVRVGKYPASDSEQALRIGNEITDDAKARIFRFNAGKEMKIFPDKHPYHKAPREVKEILSTIAGQRFTARTVEQAEEQFRDILGVNCRLDGFKKPDMERVGAIFECVERHFREFPGIKEKVKFVGSMKGRIEYIAGEIFEEFKSTIPEKPDVVMAWAKREARRRAYSKDCYAYSHEWGEKYGANGVVLNTAWTKEKLSEALKRDVNAKFHPVNCDTLKAVFDHEFGHKVDALLGLHVDADFRRIFHEAVSRGEQHVTDNLSGYAYSTRLMGKRDYTPEKEFIAEAWSEYLNNPAPREIATAIGKLIEKKREEQKR